MPHKSIGALHAHPIDIGKHQRKKQAQHALHPRHACQPGQRQHAGSQHQRQQAHAQIKAKQRPAPQAKPRQQNHEPQLREEHAFALAAQHGQAPSQKAGTHKQRAPRLCQPISQGQRKKQQKRPNGQLRPEKRQRQQHP